MFRSLSSGATSLAVIVSSSLSLAEPAAPVAPSTESAPAPTSPEAETPAAPTAPSPAAPPVATSPAAPASTAPAAPSPPEGASPRASAPPPAPAPAVSADVSISTDAAQVAASADDAQIPPAEPAADQGESWFARPPVALTLGDPERQLTITFYGILQADLMYDTTRSYSETIGSGLVARGDTYEGTVGRSQASTRNSRIGIALLASPTAGITPTALVEGDFRGNQPDDPPEISESAFYTSPTFRIRHAYLKLQNDLVDVLIGQTYDLFARQDTFDPGARNPQLRASHTFGAKGSVSFDVAAAAVRPVQRDAQLPDAQAALRLNVDGWKGIGTPRGIPSARPMSLAVTGVARQFDVDAFTPPPTQRSNKVVGWGFAVDALLPVIPAENEFDRGHKLTLTGLFVTGTGVGDLIGVDGGARFTPLPNPARANPPPEYEGNADEGLVSFDNLGVLNTIDWQAFRIGLEYYLPPIGRVMIAANYMEAFSNNMVDLYPRGGAEIELLTHVADRTRRADLDVFYNLTPEVRLGLGGSFTEVEYIDGERPKNLRARALANYYF